MLEAVTVTEPAPGGTNEDYLLVSGRWAVVLDGIGPGEAESGCVHGVPWFAARLATFFGSEMEAADPGTAMTVLLARAIERTAAGHNITCELDSPLTPSARVAAVRVEDDRLDWLVLGGATAAWRLTDGSAHAVTDDVERAAGSDPAAAKEALTGTVPRDRVERTALFSDGVARLVGRHGRTWRELFDLAESEGVRSLVETVRGAGDEDADDASVVVARLIG